MSSRGARTEVQPAERRKARPPPAQAPPARKPGCLAGDLTTVRRTRAAGPAPVAAGSNGRAGWGRVWLMSRPRVCAADCSFSSLGARSGGPAPRRQVHARHFGQDAWCHEPRASLLNYCPGPLSLWEGLQVPPSASSGRVSPGSCFQGLLPRV